MSTALNDHRLLSTRGAAWRLEPLSSTFELKVRHRFGPIFVARSFRRVDGLLQFDTSGDIRVGLTIDTATLEAPGERSDPRSRGPRFPDVGASPVTRFESTRVTDHGAGRSHVAGRLSVGGRWMPLEFGVRVTMHEGSLEVRATTVVNHRRLGLTWIPAGPLKAPTELVVRARLIRVTDDEARGSIAIARGRRSTAVNSRYSFMGGRSARPADRQRLQSG